ncbi:MAG: hypothetical protein ABUS79_31350, partial [Pseudomonadota bacterium]
RTNDSLTRMDPVMDQLAVFTGAGQFSADPDGGRKRLVDLEAELCMPNERKADAVPTVCGTLFKAPRIANPDVTPPITADPGDPRYQVCLDANMGPGLCASLNTDDKGVVTVVAKFDPLLEGAFRTPQLINIAETGPYFHTGEFKTLRDVVWHYNAGGGTPGSFVGTKSPRIRPLLLTDTEVDDLVEFLKTLTGEAPPADWACNPLQGPPLVGCGPPGSGATGGASGAGGRAAGGAGGGSAGGAGGGAGGRAGGAGGSVGNGGAAATGGVTGSGGMAAGTGGAATSSGGATGVGGGGGGLALGGAGGA